MKKIQSMLSVAVAFGVLSLAASAYGVVVFEDDFTSALPTTNTGLWQNGNRPIYMPDGTQTLAWDGVSSAVGEVSGPSVYTARTGMVSLGNVLSVGQLTDANSTITAKVTFGPTALTGSIFERPEPRLTLTPKQPLSSNFYDGVNNLIEGRVKFGYFVDRAQLDIRIGTGINGNTSLFQTYLDIASGAGDTFSYTISSSQLLEVTYYSQATDTTYNLLSNPVDLVFLTDMATDFANGARLGLVHWQELPGGTSSSSWDNVQVQVNPIPEPASLSLLVIGALAMLYRPR